MKAKWLGLCLCLLMSGAMAAPVNKVVIFGDSLSDTGNLYEYMRHQLPMSPPYNNGRFTDGAVWIEHVLEHYFPTDAKLRLLNYAFGGSGVGSEDENEDEGLNDGAMLNLDSEVSSYLLAHDDKADPASLYVVWMGSNNYLSLPEALDDEVQFTLTGIRRSLDVLVQKGAKHIMVVGVPDLGQIPMAREFEYVDELTYLSNQHNIKLKEMIEELKTLNSDVQWVFYDVFSLLTEAVNSPETYGFKDVTGTCYDSLDYVSSSQPILSMAARIEPRVRTANACDTYLFFDPVHPSGRAHEYIADRGIKALDAAGVKFE
ncbi:MAG: SGNH/GDSL hydrolase family protein [Gammaproteobacteria bacterium]|nr:SGNH/GDSL hydrolase family protein [Gammaproteobacteria bacterium]MCH9762901.1 SGNH/GDSL hydrolase family protein [Gammaproteobacteria bacterium]